MKGLDIRCQYATGKVMRSIRPQSEVPDEAEALLFEAALAAESMGYFDFGEGLTEPPLLFVDESELVTRWEWGWSFAGDCNEMSTCASCEEANGDPCPFHD